MGTGDGVVSHGFGGASVGDGVGPGSGGAVESHGSAASAPAARRANTMPGTFMILSSLGADKTGEDAMAHTHDKLALEPKWLRMKNV